MNTAAKTAIEITKWASFVSHVKNNRIEYLLLLGLLHLVGVTTRVYSEVEGLCV